MTRSREVGAGRGRDIDLEVQQSVCVGVRGLEAVGSGLLRPLRWSPVDDEGEIK